MATTTNYGFEIPDDTDLVKDGALAMRDLGQDVDTQLFTALGGDYPGLRLVKKQTVGTGVSSVAVTSAFSATYENYLVVYSNGTASGANLGLQFQLGSTTTGYAYALVYALYSTGAGASLGAANASSFPYAGGTNGNGANILATIEQPFLAKNTFIANTYRDDTAAGTNNGVLKNTTSYTGFTINVAGGGNITGGTIYVYGMGIS
jgi:hypothetical protein